MKSARLLFSVFCAVAAGGAVADPSISAVSMAQDPVTKIVTVDYTLADGPAIVTVSVTTNGVAANGSFAESMWGDWGRKFDTGSHKIFWAPGVAWPEELFAAQAVEVKLTAWMPETPPDYLVVDLIEQESVRYYESADLIPYGGLLGETNLCQKLVMRRIPAKDVVWRMGIPSAEAAEMKKPQYFTNSIPHYVKLTQDYYIGVFEFTRGQWNRIYFTAANAPDWNLYSSTHEQGSPAECQNNPSQSFYTLLRGSSGANWPDDGHAVAATSVLGKLRAKTGIDFDLPTDAEWEYACRAGTSTPWNSGKKYKGVNNSEWDAWGQLGWRQGNNGGNFYGHHVGGKLPNAWGLYDMHGNVAELTLDWYSSGEDYLASFGGDQATPVVDPKGPKTGTSRCSRGGHFNAGPDSAVAGFRETERAAGSAYYQGFRVVCPILP